MKFEHTQVWGFEHALRGMRNPKESWARSDSYYELLEEYAKHEEENPVRFYIIGKNDMELAQKLIRAGSEHRKFMRQIFVSADITAPMHWWKHFDKYKIGTTTNSTSTMHKLSKTKITKELFEINPLGSGKDEYVHEKFANFIIENLEELRISYLRTGDKWFWNELIFWLPESWLYKETTTMNYENVYTMVRQRKSHKLNEWSGIDNQEFENFVKWSRTLPYAQELIFLDED